MNNKKLSDEQYGLLFDVRRSIRYHEYRRNFYQQLHKVTNLLTILMAGAVLVDLAKKGDVAFWLIGVSTIAALFSALDMVIGYANQANLHSQLRGRFADLEIAMVTGSNDENVWLEYQRQRLLIEKDEPAIYMALDLLCRNELLIAEGFNQKTKPENFFRLNAWHRLTRNFWRWENITQNAQL